METLTRRYHKPRSHRPAGAGPALPAWISDFPPRSVMTVSAGPAPRRARSLCTAALPGLRSTAGLRVPIPVPPRRRAAPTPPPSTCLSAGTDAGCVKAGGFFPRILFGKNLLDAVTRCFNIAESAALIFQFEIFIYIFFFLSFHISFVSEPKASQGIPAAPLSWG